MELRAMSFTTKKPGGEIVRRLTVYLTRSEELELERMVRETNTSKAALGLKAIRKLLDEACRGERAAQSG